MSQNDILIRAAEPEDIPAVTEICSQPRAVWGTLQRPYVSVDERRKRFETNEAGRFLLVAEIDGKVVGIAGLTREKPPRRAHAASIGLTVHDAFAGRGAGRALVGALVEQADLWLNLTRLELTVFCDNERAIRLYEGFGFEREGRLRAYAWRNGAWADCYAMARLRPERRA
jgi:putative acetyltransferase